MPSRTIWISLFFFHLTYLLIFSLLTGVRFGWLEWVIVGVILLIVTKACASVLTRLCTRVALDTKPLSSQDKRKEDKRIFEPLVAILGLIGGVTLFVDVPYLERFTPPWQLWVIATFVIGYVSYIAETRNSDVARLWRILLIPFWFVAQGLVYLAQETQVFLVIQHNTLAFAVTFATGASISVAYLLLRQFLMSRYAFGVFAQLYSWPKDLAEELDQYLKKEVLNSAELESSVVEQTHQFWIHGLSRSIIMRNVEDWLKRQALRPKIRTTSLKEMGKRRIVIPLAKRSINISMDLPLVFQSDGQIEIEALGD
jgi:hypothetical protein